MIQRLRAKLGPAFADPAAVSMVVAAGLCVVGLVTILLGWRGAAATLFVPDQVPYLVSGGLGGTGLVIAGAGILHAQLRRRFAADERHHLESVLAEMSGLVLALEAARQPASPVSPAAAPAPARQDRAARRAARRA